MSASIPAPSARHFTRFIQFNPPNEVIDGISVLLALFVGGLVLMRMAEEDGSSQASRAAASETTRDDRQAPGMIVWPLSTANRSRSPASGPSDANPFRSS
jgi:hypothetical protein